MSEWIVLAFLAGFLVGVIFTGWLAEKFMAAKFRSVGLGERWDGSRDE